MLVRPRQRGFTLLELIVVITLLALIAVVIAPQMFGRAEQAKQKAAQIQVEKVANAIQLYKLEVGRYPESLEDLLNRPSGVDNWNGPYLQKKALLLDPWGHEFTYTVPGQHGRFDLISLGSDGTAGGTEDAADIGNWE